MPDTGSRRRIALGADHGGFELKEVIGAHLRERGYSIEDCGTDGTESVDYPVFAHAVARLVSQGKADYGVVVDRVGIGSAMAANKLPGVRAAPCRDVSAARSSREHNNANVLTLGAGLLGPDLALQIVDSWLTAECTEERHLRRAAMIEPSRATSQGAVADRPPAPKADQEQRMDSLSEADVERIVRRVCELSGASRSGAPGTAIWPDLAYSCCQTGGQANPDSLRQLVDMGADRVAHLPGAGVLPVDLAKYIDHTLLNPDATAQHIMDLCDEARKYGFASVCVNPSFARLAADRLHGFSVKVCCVVGFPLGAHVPEIKALEARRAIRDGAREIDMVINIGALKGGDDQLVYRDIRTVTEACMDGGASCKVIIEAAFLTDDEKVRACHAAKRARADFVKTSTGFGPGGATAHDVALMADAVRGTRMGIKAAGGIRSYEDAQRMIRAGATRLGASAGVRIIREAKGLTVSAHSGAPETAKAGVYE
ncbi:MAG: deoxyribose-phosphate aldolase [Phycisphaerales bacterium]|nr:MAG: deoxyribose-phosphate aldolase [Phycisphaerales bacterium]